MKLRAILAALMLLLASPDVSAKTLGLTSWYGPREHGRLMANGDRFDQWGLTVAHRTLPFGTKLQVRNPANGKTVRVTVTDRGPYITGRSLDVSRKVARILNIEEDGLAVIEIKVLSKPPKRKRT